MSYYNLDIRFHDEPAHSTGIQINTEASAMAYIAKLGDGKVHGWLITEKGRAGRVLTVDATKVLTVIMDEMTE